MIAHAHAQIQNCTRDLRRAACALLNASGPVVMTGPDLAALGVSLLDLSSRIESAVAETVVEDILRREEARVIDVEFREVRS